MEHQATKIKVLVSGVYNVTFQTIGAQFFGTVKTDSIGISLCVWNSQNCIGGVIVCILASSAVDRGFEPRSGQTKDYKIGICCFSAKYAALRRKSKDGLAWNHNNVSE